MADGMDDDALLLSLTGGADAGSQPSSLLPRPSQARRWSGRQTWSTAAAACIVGASLALLSSSGSSGPHGPHGPSSPPAESAVVLDADRSDVATGLFDEALQDLEVKVPKSTPAPPQVFLDPYPWHKDDMERYAVQSRLREPNYKGEEGMWCVGVNVMGFGMDAGGGRFGRYSHARFDQLEYFRQMGANCFRLSVTWERLQSRLGSEELDPVHGIKETVGFITSHLGYHVIIDPHNGASGLMHNNINAMRTDFVKLWIAIAKLWGSNEKVIFGLYNEPRHGFEDGRERYFDPGSQDADGEMLEFWRQWAQEAIDAIRRMGSRNLILVPGLQRSMSAAWSGAARWGEALDGLQHAGNTRLAALRDPAMNLAYDVHQHMDADLSGRASGCQGHQGSAQCQGQPHCLGADQGLARTIAWAKRYNKKLMMTEVSSVPGGDGTEAGCKDRMHAYLQQMKDSGVFIGYQVYQSGCPDCLGDLWAQRPLNLDWYRLHEFGRGCAVFGADCRDTKCCSDPTHKCYQKNDAWAGCKAGCTPGIDPTEEKEFQSNWTCVELSCTVPDAVCSNNGQDCSQTKCCNDLGKRCYKKDDTWSMCRSSCNPGQIWERDAPENQTPWNCTVLGVHAEEVQLK